MGGRSLGAPRRAAPGIAWQHRMSWPAPPHAHTYETRLCPTYASCNSEETAEEDLAHVSNRRQGKQGHCCHAPGMAFRADGQQLQVPCTLLLGRGPLRLSVAAGWSATLLGGQDGEAAEREEAERCP